ncbi:hypothetical protein QR680_008815 [Steinernema hermaphroditum]|uniref:Uncharacterized protein n=1 Tax=Steinernema hermaphroditum TaxID=289476 RepID=A0AA39M8C6_9BILA|nr:hypothetical protein QR680_008815 [Steinernema hermaphroditum]
MEAPDSPIGAERCDEAIDLKRPIKCHNATVRAFYYRMHVFEMNVSSTLARRGRTVGEIVNLISVDVDNFKEFMENSMYVLLMPLAISTTPD